ncbi:MAG TPA: hypothetical protein VFT45_04180 [Longimicrobium sp.]|nr:hypothetical protein [Longimicrobium sp.]
MKKKHAPPPDRDLPPAMFVGDELATSLPAQTPAAAAMLPDDLRVVIEGTSAGRLLLITVGLLAAVILGMIGVDWISSDGSAEVTDYAFVVVGVGVLAWLVHRHLVRRHREFRLGDDGLTVEVTPLAGGPLRVTHVPWTETTDYTVAADGDKAFLRVESVHGYTVTLLDRPPRPSTREFIRRFVEQAELHPRAVARPRKEGSPLPDVTGERERADRGCVTWFAIIMLTSTVETFLDPSLAQKVTVIAVVGLIVTGVAFWFDLDDPEIAGSDAESNRLVARLRRWLRRVMGIRVG